MDFPYYCTTLEESEMCADQIAKEHDLQHKTRTNDHLFMYESDTISLTIKIFYDNWHKKQHCYSFELVALHRKDIGISGFLPYSRMLKGNLKRQSWRKRPSYFANDIRKSIDILNSVDKFGRVEGEIYEWRNGYGFARTNFVPKVFVWGGEIPNKTLGCVASGTKLKFKIVDTVKGPRAADIVVVGQHEIDKVDEAPNQVKKK
ncbi:hypothetical protein IQ225_03675 [Synechocystis salina LEGE 06155]|nr:hypothetical protein [Synechocystis salina LEGE 06155]